ncbi:MAG: hypothetical protein ABI980_03940 [Nitrospirota bacterium]
MASVLFLLLGVVGTIAAISYSFGIARGRLGRVNRITNGRNGNGNGQAVSLDTHIASQWTEGRLRLDSVLTLITQLGTSLEHEVERLRRLDHSDPLYENEARQMVEPTLRRFTFDQHLREECRVLVPLLQFCAQDLADSQGIDMTKKLSVLAEIQASIESVDRR